MSEQRRKIVSLAGLASLRPQPPDNIVEESDRYLLEDWDRRFEEATEESVYDLDSSLRLPPVTRFTVDGRRIPPEPPLPKPYPQNPQWAQGYSAKIDKPPGKPPTGGSNVMPPPKSPKPQEVTYKHRGC